MEAAYTLSEVAKQSQETLKLSEKQAPVTKMKLVIDPILHKGPQLILQALQTGKYNDNMDYFGLWSSLSTLDNGKLCFVYQSVACTFCLMHPHLEDTKLYLTDCLVRRIKGGWDGEAEISSKQPESF
ncbi:hypothetical protein CHS0354_037801 [Potamilus streckersoni]|uniref:Uncharacterized protein n=1 Tax=Potamilus streckersoni TaxID=2493646 RepID=A0AAE0VYN3_9BIVA|nr:hypothetical protein CHS0354_037801 [Potamilus streckersoni]